MAYLHLEFYRGGGGQGKNNIVVCRLQGGPVSWIVFACGIKHDTEIQAARVDVLLTRECYKARESPLLSARTRCCCHFIVFS